MPLQTKLFWGRWHITCGPIQICGASFEVVWLHYTIHHTSFDAPVASCGHCEQQLRRTASCDQRCGDCQSNSNWLPSLLRDKCVATTRQVKSRWVVNCHGLNITGDRVSRRFPRILHLTSSCPRPNWTLSVCMCVYNFHTIPCILFIYKTLLHYIPFSRAVSFTVLQTWVPCRDRWGSKGHCGKDEGGWQAAGLVLRTCQTLR